MGYRGWCRSCHAEYDAEHREQIRERKRQYREANRDQIDEYQRQWHAPRKEGRLGAWEDSHEEV